MRLIDADHLSERVNNSADTPMQKLYVDALLAGEPTVAEPPKKPMNNTDRIRAMSDEELADKFTDVAHEAHAEKGEAMKKRFYINWDDVIGRVAGMILLLIGIPGVILVWVMMFRYLFGG